MWKGSAKGSRDQDSLNILSAAQSKVRLVFIKLMAVKQMDEVWLTHRLANFRISWQSVH